ncbi:MAG: HIT family protein [Patescibacteria group bacterium]|nr:HIT family protein [Patescibacteria group bacterium]
MDNCLFCKIIAGEIPAEKVYEDEKVLAILDIKPVNPGDVLIITKEHAEDMLGASKENIEAAIMAAQKMGLILKKALGAGGVNIRINNGELAEQMIKHAHIHVIPRFENDGRVDWVGKEYGPGEFEAMGEKIRQAFKE